MNLRFSSLYRGIFNKFVTLFTSIIIAVFLGLFISCVKAQDTETNQKKYEDFDANNFSNPTEIDNEWMPLSPGMQYIYEGSTLDDEGELLDHLVVITVTDLTKFIGEVECRVSWDLDYSDGELVEAELAFFAQDDEGNVWRIGEYPEEYEDGKFIEAPCWLNGFKGSIAGISMRSNPELGTPSYSQGYAPDVDFTDRGQVDHKVVELCVPVKCYENVIVISEGSEAELNAKQLKYFAPGVGNIKVSWSGAGEQTREMLELVEIKKLNTDEMLEVRNSAFELENHAYERSPDVYGLTEPLIVPK